MNEWKFIQQVSPDANDQLIIIDKAIKEKVMPALYGLISSNNNNTRMKFIDLPIKYGGLASTNPSKDETTSYNNSQNMSKYLSDSLQQKTQFNFTTHLQIINEVKKHNKFKNSNTTMKN